MAGFFQAMMGLMSGPPGIVSLPSPINAFATGVSASASITLNADGTASATGTALSAWISPTFTGAGNFYQCRLTDVTGNTPSGTLDTWLDLSSNRGWSLTESAGGVACSGTLEIRNKITQATLVSVSVSIEVSPE